MDTPQVHQHARPSNTLIMVLAATWAATCRLMASAWAAVVPNRHRADPVGPVSRRALLAVAREERAQSEIQKGAVTMIVGAILTTIGIVIGLIMYPIATSSATAANDDPNTTARDKPLITLLPTLLVLLLVLAGVGTMFVGFQQIKGL